MASRSKSKGNAKGIKRKVVNEVLKQGRNPQLLKEAMALKTKLEAPGPRTGGMGPFSGVSSMSAAPVSLGNTVRSVKQTVTAIPGGVRVVGRDFVMAVGGQNTTWKEWTFQGGMALSPIALNASGLRGFFQTYEHYQFLRAHVHYITSSPTSTAGDVLVMYHANRGGPKVNHASNNFLSYALSTDSAFIGPQWTNHSVAVISRPGPVRGTDVLNAEDVEHQADGEVLVYTQATTNGASADSPGYLLIDYDIVFRDRMLNPRVNTLPSGVFKWKPTSLLFSGAPAVWDQVQVDLTGTNTYTGAAGTAPLGVAAGVIFQVVVDLQHVVFGGTLAPGSEATMWSVVVGYTGLGATQSFDPMVYPITTGTTLYGVMKNNLTAMDLFPSYDAVFAGNSLRWSAASAGASISTACVLSAVGSVSPQYLQSNIG